MRRVLVICVALALLLCGCGQKREYKEILAFPVYGQSHALAESAERVSDNNELQSYGGRILTQNLDTKFGYFADTWLKQRIKRLIGYKKRSFEISSYGMAEYMIDNDMIDKGSAICIFPGGRGATQIDGLEKGSQPYHKFLKEIKCAYKKASKQGVKFRVPAVCWMQGESDITNGGGATYKAKLLVLRSDMSNDIKKITGQKEEVKFICYQANCITLAKTFNNYSFSMHEMEVPQSQLELVINDNNFIPSGPLYPYNYVDNYIHLDGVSQKRFGAIAALAAQRLLRGEAEDVSLYPSSCNACNDTVIRIAFKVPAAPLVFDTIAISKVDNYGFSVLNKSGVDILRRVQLEPESVILYCNDKVSGTQVRYAVNGEKMKSGRIFGPRGNLRDSQGNSYSINIKGKIYSLPNWCWQFILPVR